MFDFIKRPSDVAVIFFNYITTSLLSIAIISYNYILITTDNYLKLNGDVTYVKDVEGSVTCPCDSVKNIFCVRFSYFAACDGFWHLGASKIKNLRLKSDVRVSVVFLYLLCDSFLLIGYYVI